SISGRRSSLCLLSASTATCFRSRIHIDNGVRVSAAQLREQVRAAMPEAGYLAAGPQLAAAAPPAFPTQVALAYHLDVYKFTERGFYREFVFLFRKPRPVLNCLAK